MKISGIIFDKDGTLLDFNEFWIPAAQCVIRRILSDYKIPVTDIHTEKALNSIGIIQNHVLPDGLFAWKTFLDMAIDMKPALEAMHAQAPVDTRNLEGKLTRYFDEESFAENKSIKGIGDLPAILQPLHEKSIHFGVATTDTCEAALKCLKGLQILPLFSFFAGDQMAGGYAVKAGWAHHFARCGVYCLPLHLCKKSEPDQPEYRIRNLVRRWTDCHLAGFDFCIQGKTLHGWNHRSCADYRRLRNGERLWKQVTAALCVFAVLAGAAPMNGCEVTYV